MSAKKASEGGCAPLSAEQFQAIHARLSLLDLMASPKVMWPGEMAHLRGDKSQVLVILETRFHSLGCGGGSVSYMACHPSMSGFGNEYDSAVLCRIDPAKPAEKPRAAIKWEEPRGDSPYGWGDDSRGRLIYETTRVTEEGPDELHYGECVLTQQRSATGMLVEAQRWCEEHYAARLAAGLPTSREEVAAEYAKVIAADAPAPAPAPAEAEPVPADSQTVAAPRLWGA
jgi:hypothetical protein